MAERLGVLGGTFDPLHVGHLVVAQDVVEELGLDRLLVVPAARPPHREAVFPAGERLAMAETAFGDDSRIEVSDLEHRREGPSYTVDTLAAVRADRSPERLFCVIGADQLREFGGWHRPERILELATLAVMDRGTEGAPTGAEGESPPEHRRVSVTRVDLSSTRLRDRLDRGLTVRYLVPESIRERVEEGWPRHAPAG